MHNFQTQSTAKQFKITWRIKNLLSSSQIHIYFSFSKGISYAISWPLFLILTRLSVTRKKVQQKYFSRCFPSSPFSAYLSKKQKTKNKKKQNFTDTELSVTCRRKCNYSCMVCAEYKIFWSSVIQAGWKLFHMLVLERSEREPFSDLLYKAIFILLPCVN